MLLLDVTELSDETRQLLVEAICKRPEKFQSVKIVEKFSNIHNSNRFFLEIDGNITRAISEGLQWYLMGFTAAINKDALGVLREFCRKVDASGGVDLTYFGAELKVNPKLTDLGAFYLKACMVLGQKPKV